MLFPSTAARRLLMAGWSTRQGIALTRSVVGRRHLSTPATQFVYSPAVRAALDSQKPVVALESTIITHGMPFPANVDTARDVERIIRNNGAEPATIAILDGQVHVGLTDEALMHLGQLKRDQVTKTSRRDFAPVLARKGNGATTVSGTMVVAEKAGIDVFVTGGIGGVHRGAETTFDVSADLTELGRTPVAVICAGVKSILDIPKTLEYLETQGVTVTTHAPTPDFPAFYTPTSGLVSPNHSPTIGECASIIYHNRALNLRSGVVIAVPNPDAADADLIQRAVDQAVRESHEQGISGKDATPFLLARVAELTGGKSLEANIGLIRNNAKVGAQIAVALARMRVASAGASPSAVASAFTPATNNNDTKNKKRPVLIGGLVMDITSTLASAELVSGSSYPGRVTQTPGGVARNMTEALHRVCPGANPVLVSATGGDVAGSMLVQSMAQLGLATHGVIQACDARTAVYSALHTGQGELVTAVADMDILKSQVTADRACKLVSESRASLVVVDGNVDDKVFGAVVDACATSKVPAPVIFEPTSIPKSTAMPWLRGGVTYATPNTAELEAMANAWREAHNRAWPEHVNDALVQEIPIEGVKSATQAAAGDNNEDGGMGVPELIDSVMGSALVVTDRIPRLLIKCGAQGVVYIERLTRDFREPKASWSMAGELKPFVAHASWAWAGAFKALASDAMYVVGWSRPQKGGVKVKNVTGAGDTLVGVFVGGLSEHGCELGQVPAIVASARRAAERTVESDLAVSEELGPDVFTGGAEEESS
ncbi:Indigoidine synthase A like protein-domain-containing protein [Catenaria anguillulae PL171]|uniref:Indigoidine synthase A like protein-domain-containing protein n=1 Tax=Catenaria anguillulae PL171 TaxID=765915 RepID=A0A1Y2HAW9_9FUNG|nr:Indigoidine synthase A like protein-domain-containing protein [Catenaria anguillulae PL171]